MLLLHCIHRKLQYYSNHGCKSDRFLLFEFQVAFTLNGFNDQERKLTFVKTDFHVLKLKFHACNFKQAFYPFHKLYIA